jgi:hypothetical protein
MTSIVKALPLCLLACLLSCTKKYSAPLIDIEPGENGYIGGSSYELYVGHRPLDLFLAAARYRAQGRCPLLYDPGEYQRLDVGESAESIIGYIADPVKPTKVQVIEALNGIRIEFLLANEIAANGEQRVFVHLPIRLVKIKVLGGPHMGKLGWVHHYQIHRISNFHEFWEEADSELREEKSAIREIYRSRTTIRECASRIR